MKILLASRRPAYPFFQGGAERSFYELARALAARGHRVVMIGECGPLLHDLDAFFAGAEIVSRRWVDEETTIRGESFVRRRRLICELPDGLRVVHTFSADFRALAEEVVRDFEPHVLCTQLEGAIEVSQYCRFTGAHVLHFVRDTANPFNYFPLARLPGAPSPPVVVANSHFTADFVRRRFGIEPRVLYPIVRLDRPPGGHLERRSVLLINPIPSKGGEVLYRAACELPELSFRVLPGWAFEVGMQWRALPNVEAWDWPVLDMAAAYRSVELVVLPSQAEEGFGRVAIEAQCAGTPVLAARHSGLAEILEGSAGLVGSFEDPAAWRDAIRQALGDRQSLRRWRAAGLANARRFEPGTIAVAFEGLVAELDEAAGAPEKR